MKNGVRFIVMAAAAMVVVALGSGAQAGPASETARTSNLTGTALGSAPERDLRPEVISGGAGYLGQLVGQADPAAKVSDVEVLFWRNAVQPRSVEAYQKLVTDNLARGGYVYMVTASQTAAGSTTTQFTAECGQRGRVVDYWQTSAQGLFLNWGRVSGEAVPMPPPPPTGQAPAAAPAGRAAAAADKDAEIAELKRQLAKRDATKTPADGADRYVAPATAAPISAGPTLEIPLPASPAPAIPAAVAPTAAAPAAGNVPLHPLEQSDVIIKGADGASVVAAVRFPAASPIRAEVL